MEFLTLSTKLFAYVSAIVSVLGSISHVIIYITAASNLKMSLDLSARHIEIKRLHQSLNGTENEMNFTRTTPESKSFSLKWNFFLRHSILLHEATFPIMRTNLLNDQDEAFVCLHDIDNDLKRGAYISISDILMTLMSSFFLVKGSRQMDYTSCQFWYYIQVGSLLLSCMKISIVALVGLWSAVANTTFISILFGLFQLWLVQKFMENLSLRLESIRQKKCHTQIFAMNDLDLESCQFAFEKQKFSEN